MTGVLSLALAVLSLCAGKLSAQDVTVNGIVMDGAGARVAGATVIVQNSTSATITDANGEYRITAPGNSSLVISSFGFETQTVAIGGRSIVNVTLSNTAFNMDEVVVVGYGTQSRRTITSAITKVSGEDVHGVPFSTVGEALKGKIAGARVYSNDNTPGADPVIRIRGGSSIDGSNNVLVLIDGMERPLAGLNANDIESMEVLKDAASTAIYGSRASNGVVLITTRTGQRAQAPRITFETSVALQQIERRYDLMGAEDYIRMVRTSMAQSKNPANNHTSGFSASDVNDANSVYSTRYLEEGESVPDGYKKMRDPLDNTKWLIFQDNDWQDVLYRDNFWQNYYVSIDGGSENTTYMATMGYTKDDGVAIGTSFSRFNARMNLTSNITRKLKARAMMDFSHIRSKVFDSQMNSIHRGLSAAPTMKRYMDDGTPAHGYNGTSLNPEYTEYIFDNSSRNRRISMVGGLDWTIIDGLKATAEASMYNQSARGSKFRKRGYFSNATPTTENYVELLRTKFDVYLNYSKSFGLAHSLSVTGGYSYQSDSQNNFAASAEGGGSDKTPTLSAQPDRTSSTSSFSEIVMLSYFGRLNYDYKKRYLLSMTFRADGSSKFVQGNQWGYFPAMSAGWMISEESFMNWATAIDDLKLRVSVGQTGNNYIGVNDALGNYTVSFYDGSPGMAPSATMPNANLMWETTLQTDVGFDLSMLGNRLMISADYFNRLTDNLIYTKDLPNTAGYTSVKTNLGQVRFRGFEVEVSSKNIERENFSWESKFNWSFVKNKVVKLPDNGMPGHRVGGISINGGEYWVGGIAEGEPMYRLYGMKVSHIIKTQEQLDNALYDTYAAGYNPDDGTTVAGRKNMGDYEWVNREGSSLRNGEEQINAEDRFLLGYSVPHSTGGLNNRFKYKNLSLGVHLDWALGHTVLHTVMARHFINTFTGNFALHADVLDSWSPENPDAKYARFYTGGETVSSNFKNNADTFAYKADYLCLREVSLSYDLPQKLLSGAGIKGLTVSLSGNNLHYFTAVPGISPEVGSGSTGAADYNNHPAIRRVTLGLKLTF
jgi:TonB-linked SusC/RagA family outer membrane protein